VRRGKKWCRCFAVFAILNSIRQERAYKIFWARTWLIGKQQPMVFHRNEALIFLSQKFVVDCPRRRFGSRFIDSNEPVQMKHKAAIETMRWEALERFPAVGRLVCEGRGDAAQGLMTGR